jgi:predicted nucleic acid-binding protein
METHKQAPKLVLDTNCLIDLEEGRPDAIHIKALIEASRNGLVQLAVAAISASENQRDGVPIQNYAVFEERLARLDLRDVQQLLPLATWDIGYWDHMLWSSVELDAQAQEIRASLFPNDSPASSLQDADAKKWRNRHCDAMLAWCCIYHGWDSLITSDQNFHKRQPELGRLGLGSVLTPEQAASRYATQQRTVQTP